MTPEERDQVRRETIAECAAAVRAVQPVVHARGVNGVATLARAADALLAAGEIRTTATSARPVADMNFAERQRAGLPRPAQP